MCLTVPAKITALENHCATVTVNGRTAEVLIGTAEPLAIGDDVLTTGDYLIKKIDPAEAAEISALLKAAPAPDPQFLPEQLKAVLTRAARQDLQREDLKYLLALNEPAWLEAVYAEANTARKANIKDHICVHGIIEFSNHCRNNCAYCGLRRDNQVLSRYRLSVEEIVAAAVSAVNDKGYKILVLQSGEDLFYTRKKLVEIISRIKQAAKCFIYLSIGDRSAEDYQAFKAAGGNGVLYRFETSNPQLYAKLHPGKRLAERLKLLKIMKDLGYVISTGMIVGLPGQTLDDLADDIALLKELGTFMPSIGPLIPTKHTPLAGAPAVDFTLLLKVLAAVRLYLPAARLPVTTAMETLGGGEDARQKCFLAGANSIMFNLTPQPYRAAYRIYDHKFYDAEKRYEKWALFKGELSYEMLENELGFSI